jgi:hypothetical protein
MKPYQRVALRYASQNIEFVEKDDFANKDSTHSIEIIINHSTWVEPIGFVEGKFGEYTLEEISEYACSEDMLALYELWHIDADIPDDGIPVFEVLESDLNEDYRSKKLGLQMYKELGNLARGESYTPMFFIPNYCNTRSTTPSALRVWKSLTKSNASTSSDDVILMVDRKLR